MAELERRADRALGEMEQIIDGVSVNTIQAEGMTIRLGGKLVTLKVENVEVPSIEDEIREEFRDKLRERLGMIKNSLNSKITEMVQYTSRIRDEYERKEREYKEKIRRAKPMPDVFWQHAQKGLSVLKGSGNDTIIWLVQGIYWPKFVDGKTIEPKYAKKLLTNVTYLIETNNEKVLRVSTRKPLGLDYFEHYHQQTPDCWGKWKPQNTWNRPEDIINIAREAEAVLENVNTGSIANRAPRGLPRLETLRRHLIETKREKPSINILNQAARRTGIGGGIRIREDEDMWSA